MLHVRTMFAGMIGQSQHTQRQPLQPNTSKFVSTKNQLAEDTTSFSNSKISRNQPRFGMDGTTHPQNQPDNNFFYLDHIDHLVEGEDFDIGELIPTGDVTSSSTPQTTSKRDIHNQTERQFRERKKRDITYMEEHLINAGISPEHLKPSLPRRGPKQQALTHNEVEAAFRARKIQYLGRLKAEFIKLMVRQNSPQLLEGIESKRLKNSLAKEFNSLKRQTPVISIFSSFQEAAENATDPLRKEYDEDRL